MSLDLEIRDDRDARYASHVPVLQAWLSRHNWDIIEFGCGRFSTPVLAGYANSLICFEKSPTWRAQVQKAVPSADMRGIPTELGDFRVVFRDAIAQDNVVFVDGSPGAWRVDAIRCAQQKQARLIFAHDWSDKQVGYGYHRLEKRDDYFMYVYRCNATKIRTAVFLYVPVVPGNELTHA